MDLRARAASIVTAEGALLRAAPRRAHSSVAGAGVIATRLPNLIGVPRILLIVAAGRSPVTRWVVSTTRRD